MKVLQTIGVYGGTQQAAVFQYKRTPTHVVIQPLSNTNQQTLALTHEEWSAILDAIAKINAEQPKKDTHLLLTSSPASAIMNT